MDRVTSRVGGPRSSSDVSRCVLKKLVRLRGLGRGSSERAPSGTSAPVRALRTAGHASACAASSGEGSLYYH